MRFKANEIPEDLTQILRDTGSMDPAISGPAQALFAKAIALTLRQGVMFGDILDGIYQAVEFQPGATVEFPLDLLAPGTEKDFVAYTISNQGRLPERNVEGDYVQVPTYPIGNTIDWLLRYAREARWDIVGRCMEILEAGFVKKMNDDGWHCLLGAAYDRNILVYDADSGLNGTFTKRLVSLMKVIMRRNGGGNSTSLNRRKLTDMYMSPEAIEDIRNWNVDQLDEFTRRDMFLQEDGKMMRIFQVNLHDLDEFGALQEYDNYFRNDLGATISGVEALIGMDLSRDDSFMMPVRQQIEIFPDAGLHRSQREGYYGWGEFGFAALDNRDIIAGSL